MPPLHTLRTSQAPQSEIRGFTEARPATLLSGLSGRWWTICSGSWKLLQIAGHAGTEPRISGRRTQIVKLACKTQIRSKKIACSPVSSALQKKKEAMCLRAHTHNYTHTIRQATLNFKVCSKYVSESHHPEFLMVGLESLPEFLMVGLGPSNWNLRATHGRCAPKGKGIKCNEKLSSQSVTPCENLHPGCIYGIAIWKASPTQIVYENKNSLGGGILHHLNGIGTVANQRTQKCLTDLT